MLLSVKKNNYFCSPKIPGIIIRKLEYDEKDISAIEQKEKKQARIP